MPKARKSFTRIGKRGKLSRAMQIVYRRKCAKEVVGDIISDLLETVEKEKQSTRDCKEILNQILEGAFATSQQKTVSRIYNVYDDEEPTCSTHLEQREVLQSSSEEDITVASPSQKEKSSDDEYDFSDPTLLEEYERIMSYPLDVEFINEPKKLNGYRIVDIDYFLKMAMTVQISHNKKCTGGRLHIIEEKKNGIRSMFILQCNICEKQITLFSEDPKTEKSIINTAAVWGTLSTGSTYTHLAELLSVMDIPVLSANKFYQIQRELSEVWKNSLWSLMEEAGKAEREAAMQRENIDSDGIPFITVYLDGGWSKRSYGHTYNAASGVDVIIGKHTGKLLFVGVRNKFCSICARAENRGETVTEHRCFKNWSGASSSMEQDIIVEGFNTSIAMHGIRYKKFIADGDSTVYSRIRQRVDYGLQVTKVECMNHVVKNYSKQLYRIKKDTKGVSLQARKLLTKNITEELVKCVQSAVYGNVQDVQTLKSNIRNSVYHVFGNHFSCSEYLCNSVGDISQDKSSELTSSGLHHHIYGALSQLLAKADLLIDKETNNRAELFMSLLARFNMGKRLNLIQRDSFQLRTYLSSLKYNEGHMWHSKPWKAVFGRSPGENLKKFMCQQQHKVVHKRENPYKKASAAKRIKFSEGADQQPTEYGPNIAEIFISDAELEVEIRNLCKQIQVTSEEQKNIFQTTLGQFENPIYLTQKKNRLTASNFGAVMKRKESTSCDLLVKKILSPKSFTTASTTYGKANEGVAISIFESLYGKKVEPSGLFVDLETGFLAASPDGILNDKEIVEVKCLYQVASSGKSLKEAVENKKVACLTLEENQIKLKRKHDYFYQIQGQLAIARADVCHFIVYSGKDNPLLTECIKRDDDLWQGVMLPKLKKFYLDCVAPEIILNRRGRNLKCRDPPYITEAQLKKK